MMRHGLVRFAAVAAGAGAVVAGGLVVLHRLQSTRTRRNLEVARLGLDVGAVYAANAARKVFASAQRRVELDRERELKTADAVAERLGNMKGALMKLGQMA